MGASHLNLKTLESCYGANLVAELCMKQIRNEACLLNIRGLDPLVCLFAKIADSDQTQAFIENHAINRATAAGYGSIAVSTDPNPEDRLTDAGTTSSTQQTSISKLSAEELVKLKESLHKQLGSGLHVPSETVQRLTRPQAKKVNPTIPVEPEWFNRPNLTNDFVMPRNRHQQEITPIGSLPTSAQELLIISDLLFCMQGIPGQYVTLDKKSEDSWTFSVDESLDISLKVLTKRILPLCSNFSTVARFIESKSVFVCGMVNHALCAAMREVIKNYFVNICQLEHQLKLGDLTLHKLWFFVQPASEVMEVMACIATAINKGQCKGGAVLSLLHERTVGTTGDPRTQELCTFLAQSACVPYFDMLEKWIYKGVIRDPYDEFAVEEHESVQREKLQEDYNDAYWEQRYTICRERVPVFLERVIDKLLNTGKYLNVVRQCGQDVKFPGAQEIVYTMQEREYTVQIEKAYNFASKMLLDLLIQDKDLIGRLRSVKHYFFMDQADFMVQFMDMAELELTKNIYDVTPTRLESLLELAVRTSVANVDPYKDDLRVELLPYDLITMLFRVISIETEQEKAYKKEKEDLHLTGLEAFSFDYKVEWPVSLILSRKALTCYQLLFRHLFYTKHVESRLSSVFVECKDMQHRVPFHALRHRMLHFVQNLQYYMMFEVIEPNWKEFEDNMKEVSNVDEVLQNHTELLNCSLKDCMLTDPALLDIVHKVLVLCLKFTNFLEVMVGAKVAEDKMLSKFDSKFSKLLHSLLEKITESGKLTHEHKLMNIVYRLDFNGFYTEKLEQLAVEKSMISDQSVADAVQ
ncbi:PREDICTED: gamma-tubulin complex component 2-like [Priapulus caudatus]|uniref:Gamma-tubulin complex component n=1 Tax=Priapulus caudatus TaxID=37621 RepID=A0ABM1E5I5_PRICU|nr:PREDICTED: gamma-tubulin complex component 2-like [Priapulus caudatus]